MPKRWVAAGWLVMLLPRAVDAQVEWLLFEDTQSTSLCDVVNSAANELVVLADTGQLMLVSRTDTVLADSLVDADNFVFFQGDLAGSIEFADDGDGFRTLWWLALDGHVVTIDALTAVPSVSDLFPEDVINVPCDACEFIDNPPAGVCTPAGGGGDVILGAPPINVDICGVGLGSSAMLLMTFFGFSGLRFLRRG